MRPHDAPMPRPALGVEMTGGEAVVASLLARGVDRVFCVPGESFLPILDALHAVRDAIQLVSCRHEHGAAMMAEAHAKLTGRPGVCLVTRGPGACNGAIGVHTAFQDSTPLLFLIGQVGRPFLGREAFQEVDLARMFQPLAKHAEQVMTAERLPATLAGAWRRAQERRPGPVVLALPEDVLAERRSMPPISPQPVVPEPPDPGLLERLHRVLGDAERPLMLVGGGGWTEAARADILEFAEANDLPTCCSFRRLDLFDNRHRDFIGELGIAPDPRLVARIKAADLLLIVGARCGEITSQGYRLLPLVDATTAPSAEGPEIVHVHPEPNEFGRVFRPSLAIPCGVSAFAAAAAALAPVGGQRWQAWAAAARADYLADRAHYATRGGPFDPGAAMTWLDGALPEDAIVTVDAGNFSAWPQRFVSFGNGRRLLGATNGAMGYGVPAAIAAKLARRERVVVACVGDGGFGMTGQELATAMAHDAAIIVLVFNNRMYGTIRMHQEKRYPGRVTGTALCNPDYVTLAAAHEAHGERVSKTEEFAPAFTRAVASGRPAVIELVLDPELITSRRLLSEIASPAGTEEGTA